MKGAVAKATGVHGSDLKPSPFSLANRDFTGD